MRIRAFLFFCFSVVLGLAGATAATSRQVILVAFRPGSKTAASVNSNVAFRPGSKAAASAKGQPVSSDITLTLQAAENVDFKTSAGGIVIDAVNRTEHIVLKTPSTPSLSIKDTPDSALVLVKNRTKAKNPSYCWFERGTAFAVNPVAGSHPIVYHVTDGVSVIVTTLRPRLVPPNGSMPCP